MKLIYVDSCISAVKMKKETRVWFNALGRSTPFGGTRFGLIRSVSFRKLNVNDYSRESESITELRRQNERLHIDATKAAALYSGARVTMPKMPNKSNGFIASIRDAGLSVKPHI